MQSCIILFQSSPVTIRKSIATPVTGDSKLALLKNRIIVISYCFIIEKSLLQYKKIYLKYFDLKICLKVC